MTPTLFGRIQTRLFLLGTVGVLWTGFLGLVLSRPDGASTGDFYRTLFTALLIVAVAGVVWELVYHLLQQFRWEKDWPTIFGFVVGLPEGLATWFLLQAGLPWDVGAVPLGTFLAMFVSTWILVWAVANGPLQILLLRWRYRGGRVLGGW